MLYPKDGSCDREEVAIDFKSQPIAEEAMVTKMVNCAAVRNRAK